ncbi:MAG: hypothetical protein WAM14_00545 [Candidatus Nitrosopolaris sp.]
MILDLAKEKVNKGIANSNRITGFSEVMAYLIHRSHHYYRTATADK